VGIYSKKIKRWQKKKIPFVLLVPAMLLPWVVVLADLGNRVSLIEANQEKLSQLKLGQAAWEFEYLGVGV